MAGKFSYIEMLLGNQINGMFKDKKCIKDCIDPMGYDIRLGDEVLLVTKGVKRELKPGEAITIFPGESLLVESEEILNLPPDVCAIGSPKMSLISQGLWAHGGKTDFGFNQRLTFGFRHFGTSPISLSRGQRIFHLTFLKVHNKKTRPYSGKGIGFPTVVQSPLDDSPKLTWTLENEVKEKEAIQSARILRLMRRESSTMRWLIRVTWIASAFMIALGIVSLSIPALQNISIPSIVVTGFVEALFSVLIGWFVPRKGISKGEKDD